MFKKLFLGLWNWVMEDEKPKPKRMPSNNSGKATLVKGIEFVLMAYGLNQGEVNSLEKEITTLIERAVGLGSTTPTTDTHEIVPPLDDNQVLDLPDWLTTTPTTSSTPVADVVTPEEFSDLPDWLLEPEPTALPTDLASDPLPPPNIPA